MSWPLRILAAAAALSLAACGARPSPAWSDFGGDPDRGSRIVVSAACGSCHVIPGAPNATGLVGPPLGQFARRTIVAGVLPNTPDNLVRWLMDPQAVVPGNSMPRTGLNEAQARDVAAYLYTLR
jgi:cytochrome c1